VIRVLHVTFDLKLGGTQQVIRQIVANMDQNRFENHVLCTDGEIGELGELLQADHNIIISAVSRKPGIDLNLVSSIKSYVKDKGIEVLHCHQYTPYFYGALASLGTGVKLIFTEHGRFYPDVVSTKRQLLNRVLSLWTDAITSISKATADALIALEKLPQKKIEVIYNGINHELTKLNDAAGKLDEFKNAHGLSQDDFVFGTISRLEPIKNQKMLIKGFAEVASQVPNAKLLLIGDGAARTELEALVAELNLEASVIFTGFIVDPQSYLQLIDVFMLPSFSEGTSMTLLEAMSYSIPAIVTKVGGSPEIVIDGTTGCVTPSDDQIALVQAMMFLYNQPDKRLEYGKAAYLRFSEKFTDTVMVNNYESLYCRLLGSVNE